MRLLNTETLKLQEFFDEDIPDYAILSHRWQDNEVSYQDLQADKNKDGAGYRKILGCCAKALQDRYEWIWIDACCIDKTSSAELSEAINAMFRWYEAAALCYAYLCDVEEVVADGRRSYTSFKQSVWFTRGWTLQELLAPTEVLFLDKNWGKLGTRTSLGNEITTTTGIPHKAFTSMNSFSAAQKMSWASKRKTSRVEDLAYSLLGIFDVRMPLLYGEGEHAFIRLQEEIIRTSDDESIFLWAVDNPHEEHLRVKKIQDQIMNNMEDPFFYPVPSKGAGNLLAPKPSCFAPCGTIRRNIFFQRPHYSLTNKGLKITVKLFAQIQTLGDQEYWIPLNCTLDGKTPLVMSVNNLLGLFWVRCGYGELMGDLESALNALDEPDGSQEIYISARWPCHPVQTLERLRPQLLESTFDDDGNITGGVIQFGSGQPPRPFHNG